MEHKLPDFNRIDLESDEHTLYDLQEMIADPGDDFIYSVVERVIGEKHLRAEIECIIRDLPVPNGQTFLEAKKYQEELIDLVFNAAIKIRRPHGRSSRYN